MEVQLNYPNARMREHQRFAWFKASILSCLISVSVLAFAFIELYDLDLVVSSLFYNVSTHSWQYCDHLFFSTIDHGIVWLTSITAIGYCLVYLLTWFSCRNCWANRAGLIMVLVMLIGPVLLINGIMKPIFSRARPREVATLGGTMSYTSAWLSSNSPYRNSSFPSGYSSVGFYLIAPAMLLRCGRLQFIVLLTTGFMSGMIVGYSRVAQGGHLVSDVLCSMIVMTVISWAIAEAVFYVWPIQSMNTHNAFRV